MFDDVSGLLNAKTATSERLGSLFYDSLLDDWKNGEYRPCLFTRETVEEHAVNTPTGSRLLDSSLPVL